MTSETLDNTLLKQAMASPLHLQGLPLQCRVQQIGESGYAEAAHFIRRYYRLAFAARPHINARHLITLHDNNQRLRAAVGVNVAGAEPLFLEQYLDAPLQHCISEQSGAQVRREQIVEVASLAADGSGAGRQLFMALTEGLHGLGMEWIACTATRQVRTMFLRLGIAVQALADADPQRVADAQRWGRYYQFQPQVMAGNVPQGYGALQARGWIGGGGQRYDVVA